MKRNGKKQFGSRQIKGYLGWKGPIKRDNRGMGTVEVILIIVEIYIFYLYVFNVYTVI